MSAEVVAHGLYVPEGPVPLGDGRLAFVEQIIGRVSLLTERGVEEVSVAPGAPNSVALGDDGHLYAAQNGGVVDAWRSSVPAAPGIERIRLDGTVERVATTVAGHALRAPNDLVFGPDGRLWFTDPGEAFDPAGRAVNSRLFALGEDGGELVVERPPVYANGLAFDPTGRLVWVETYDRHAWVLEDSQPRALCQLPAGHAPDGLDIAADGRMYIATASSHGITVVAPDGEVLDLIHLDARAFPSNCCFDGSTLWVTDFGVGYDSWAATGRLWRVDTDAVGAPRVRGRV